MGKEIKSGLDTTIDEAQDITGSDAGWAAKINEFALALKSTNNALGGAALADIGTSAGDVVGVGSSGKIATSLLDTATAGGSSSSSKLPLLSAAGLIASSMLPSGSAGLKHVWKFDSRGPGNVSPDSSNQIERQHSFTWRPRRRISQADTYTGTTSILVLCTGAGGSGSYGPDSTVSNGAPGGGSIAGHAARKGGGGGAGGTAIRFFTGITETSSYEVKVGWGGAARAFNQNSVNLYGGADSSFGADVTGGGGAPGKATGNGGESTGGGFGDTYLGFYMYGGSGHDGTFDRLGAGSGGASFWGGGYSGGGGRGGTQTAAPGAGGGAANGSIGVSPFTFSAQAQGHRGNDGIVLILGF